MNATFINTIISITDKDKCFILVICGSKGFKGSRKSTHIAQVAADDAAAKASNMV